MRAAAFEKLSRLVEDVYGAPWWQRRSRTTTSCSASPATRPHRDQGAFRRRAGAPPRRERGARSRPALPRGRRGLRGALRPRAQAGLRPLRSRRRARGFAPVDTDFGSLSDVFAAFFGETLFGQGRARDRARRAAPWLAAHVRSTSPRPRRGRRSTCRCGSHGAARRAPARVRPRDLPGHMSRLRRRGSRPAGLAHRARADRPLGTAPRCDGAGRIVETPCERCEGDGRTLEDAPLDLEIPAGIHDGQRIRVRGAGHTGTLGGRAATST